MTTTLSEYIVYLSRASITHILLPRCRRAYLILSAAEFRAGPPPNRHISAAVRRSNRPHTSSTAPQFGGVIRPAHVGHKAPIAYRGFSGSWLHVTQLSGPRGPLQTDRLP